jgi:hypothetical protein
MYWYASRTKIDALKTDYDSSNFAWLRKLSIKFKSPFVEAGAEIGRQGGLFEDAKSVVSKLEQKELIIPLIEKSLLGTKPFVSFIGHAHRTIESGTYWVICEGGGTALLLLGSPAHAVGGTVDTTFNIPISADPLTALKGAFGDDIHQREEYGHIASLCWVSIAEPVKSHWKRLPKVEGVAVYAGYFPASTEMFDSGVFKGINAIAVASPIYIKQV